MIEDEAKTKYCPMSFNTPDLADCLGSGCMLWKWNPVFNPSGIDPVESTTDGRCGLGD